MEEVEAVETEIMGEEVMVKAISKTTRLKDKLDKLLSHKNLMYVGKMSRVLKTPRML